MEEEMNSPKIPEYRVGQEENRKGTLVLVYKKNPNGTIEKPQGKMIRKELIDFPILNPLIKTLESKIGITFSDILDRVPGLNYEGRLKRSIKKHDGYCERLRRIDEKFRVYCHP